MSSDVTLRTSVPSAVAQPQFHTSKTFTPPVQRPRWQQRYSAATIATYVVASVIAVSLGGVLGLGNHSPEFGDLQPWIGLIVIALTVACLDSTGAWEPPMLGQASEEF